MFVEKASLQAKPSIVFCHGIWAGRSGFSKARFRKTRRQLIVDHRKWNLDFTARVDRIRIAGTLFIG
jgi:hypothetical protein